MEPKVEEALKRLRTLTPDNLHQKTDAGYSQIVDFQAIWWRHTPSAARYYLLHHYWTGQLAFKEDELQGSQHD